MFLEVVRVADLEQVTYCGLYCDLCGQRNRIPARARALHDAMHTEGWDSWGVDTPGFRDFWTYLNDLAGSEARCSCRAGRCGNPSCSIRTCARSRDIQVCVYCSEYPCRQTLQLAKRYVNLLADGAHLKQIGLDAWTGEQEARRKTGFAYADIRNPPDAPES